MYASLIVFPYMAIVGGTQQIFTFTLEVFQGESADHLTVGQH